MTLENDEEFIWTRALAAYIEYIGCSINYLTAYILNKN